MFAGRRHGWTPLPGARDRPRAEKGGSQGRALLRRSATRDRARRAATGWMGVRAARPSSAVPFAPVGELEDDPGRGELVADDRRRGSERAARLRRRDRRVRIGVGAGVRGVARHSDRAPGAEHFSRTHDSILQPLRVAGASGISRSATTPLSVEEDRSVRLRKSDRASTGDAFEKAPARAKWGFPASGGSVLLVYGGSQGSKAINDVVAAWIEEGLPPICS